MRDRSKQDEYATKRRAIPLRADENNTLISPALIYCLLPIHIDLWSKKDSVFGIDHGYIWPAPLLIIMSSTRISSIAVSDALWIA